METRIPTAAAVLLFALTIPVLQGCGEEGGAQDAAPDSVVGSILDAVAQDAAEERAEEERRRAASPRIAPQEQEARPLRVDEMGYNEGSAQAPVKVMEFTDFGCGYCRRFHVETYPVLKEVYLDGGFVEWKHIPFVLGRFPNGLQAAVAGECAGEQDAFFPMHARIFQDQQAWRGAEDPYPIFVEMAEEEGLDGSRMQACIEGGWRDGRVRNNLRLATEVGVRGTPTFVVDNQLIPGFLPPEDFRDILDVVLLTRGITPPKR